MSSCSGVFALRACRSALALEPFDRIRVAEACRTDYCEGLRPTPSFCTTEMATDALFLEQFAPFSQLALGADLEPVLGAEGAQEIASLFANLIRQQAHIR